MPRVKKQVSTETAAAEHARLRDAALEAMDAAHDAIVAAHAAYERAVAEARATGEPKPETIDVLGARLNQSKSVKDIRAVDPREHFRRLRKVWRLTF